MNPPIGSKNISYKNNIGNSNEVEQTSQKRNECFFDTRRQSINCHKKQSTVCSIPSSPAIGYSVARSYHILNASGELNRYPESSDPSEASTLLGGEAHHNNMKIKLRGVLKQRSIIVDLLAIFFGIGTWIGVNSTFIQLPLLVEASPEGWSLPSYLSVMVQIGNLGPLSYTLVQKCCKKNDAYMIYGLLTSGTISAILTAFFYSRTANLFGSEHSVALFALTIFTAFTACTSSVLFMPYMGRFKELYLITYFIGEGLSGLLPSVVALIQGIGGTAECRLVNITDSGDKIYEKYVPPPLFGTRDFFFFVFAMMVLSFVGFLLLDKLKLSKKQYAAVQVGYGNNYVYKRGTTPVSNANDSENNVQDNNTSRTEINKESSDLAPEISICTYTLMLLLIGIISFFANGIFNSIQSYSCLPYGGQAYHLSATLSVIANPLACFLAIFLPHTSLRSILTLTGLAGLLTVYVFVAAAMSPFPPLYYSSAGAILMIIVWTILIGLVSYIKLSITTVMRSQGGKSLVWTGGLTQLGSTIGAILIFVLINFTNSFTAVYEDC